MTGEDWGAGGGVAMVIVVFAEQHQTETGEDWGWVQRGGTSGTNWKCCSQWKAHSQLCQCSFSMRSVRSGKRLVFKQPCIRRDDQGSPGSIKRRSLTTLEHVESLTLSGSGAGRAAGNREM